VSFPKRRSQQLLGLDTAKGKRANAAATTAATTTRRRRNHRVRTLR
jgi:hypothetical protein